MLVLSNDEVARLLSIEECMAALEDLYREQAAGRTLLAPRVDNIVPSAHPSSYYAFKHMGGTLPGQGVQALRINSDVITQPVIGGKPRRVKQPLANGRWVGLVLLFSTETGALAAMFPDGVMQRLRVGAANGIALKHLAREDAATLALIGSGWQAGAQLMAALAARPFREVRVYSPTRANRDAFIAEARRLHRAEIVAADSAEDCVAGADVVMAGTSSLVRVIDPRWLTPGMHVSCIKVQEVDGEVLGRCDRVVVHSHEQRAQAENILPGTPHASRTSGGWWDEERHMGYDALDQLVSGAAPGRRNAREITCFVNNVGSGLQFAAAGAVVLRKARAAGIGPDLPDDWFSEDVHP
jgi:ornithine cyclodeaminase/alanine dehydrogenase-like protein (mu-crystallin family)